MNDIDVVIDVSGNLMWSEAEVSECSCLIWSEEKVNVVPIITSTFDIENVQQSKKQQNNRRDALGVTGQSIIIFNETRPFRAFFQTPKRVTWKNAHTYILK